MTNLFLLLIACEVGIAGYWLRRLALVAEDLASRGEK